MTIYRKESLENLRQRIDLVEVVRASVDLKPAGAAYKGLCPFHDEKTASFTIQKGDRHYHCFGCGAHGDAIQFLMNHQKMNFTEAIESLAQRFQVHLERVESEEEKGPNKKALQSALHVACEFYHFFLLHTEEGHQALHYLYARGIPLDFIQHFCLGLSPKSSSIFRKFMHSKGFDDQTLLDAGLLSVSRNGGFREFFYDRIMFPVHNSLGVPIGFSARKFREETTGGKYINTHETVLFKKSKILFGLNHCRKRIAKERKAIVVEGQIDALRLIYTGFDITVAGQGTAFGEGHVRELTTLGILHVFLALDSDEAGKLAAKKIGQLFQKVGVDVSVVHLPQGYDPDLFLRERGPEAFMALMNGSQDYISYLVQLESCRIDINSPAGKNEIVRSIASQIRSWDSEVMVLEGLRKLAHLVNIPEQMIGIGQSSFSNVYIKKSDFAGMQQVDPDQILECDLLRWLLLKGEIDPNLIVLIQRNIQKEDFLNLACSHLFSTYMQAVEQRQPTDWLSLAIHLESQESQELLPLLLQKKINSDKAEEHLTESIKKILERNWMVKREEIKKKLQTGQCNDEEALSLSKEFDLLKNNPPQIK